MNNSHLTAIHRKTLSTPAKRLKELGLLTGRILDYGCGHGTDCSLLECEGYDLYYRPAMPEGKFDTILCTYVLNVLPDEAERDSILKDIASRLSPGGKGYITVRNDTESLNGWTKRGTFQALIKLDLPVVIKQAGFVTYVLT
jgi:2-polyprenyl-3-methyl-5-hydroxy-6-metoxy-1,4-benzoquinol methylase